MAPPGVVAVALLEYAERVDETSIQEMLEALAFFVGEAFFADIRFWVG